MAAGWFSRSDIAHSIRPTLNKFCTQKKRKECQLDCVVCASGTISVFHVYVIRVDWNSGFYSHTHERERDRARGRRWTQRFCAAFNWLLFGFYSLLILRVKTNMPRTSATLPTESRHPTIRNESTAILQSRPRTHRTRRAPAGKIKFLSLNWT
jgi:hypothetical protein